MRYVLLAVTVTSLAAGHASAAEWRVQRVGTPARVMAVDTVNNGGAVSEPRINAGGLWYRIGLAKDKASLVFINTPEQAKPPQSALTDGQIATGTNDVARAWFANPTARYDHGALGNTVEAGSLVIETRDGKRHMVSLDDDAVFEDLKPRLADLDGDGHDEIVVVKSYLKQGSALAIVALRKGHYEIAAETPPLGAPHRWLNPAGIADFNGDGKTDIALVRQPHVVGELELWTWSYWSDGRLHKQAVMPDAANHIAGHHALGISAVADFDGDGIPDIAIPSLDRRHLRIVSFAPDAREIASVQLPAEAESNLALVNTAAGPPAIAVGLSDGTLALVRHD